MASDLKKKKVWLKLIRLQIIDVQCCNQRIKESSEGSKSPGESSWGENATFQPSDRTGAVTNTFPQDNSTYRQITDQSILTGHEIHE